MGLRNFIKNLIKYNTPQQTTTTFGGDPNTYHFHEDYYCQIEYLPKENFNSASKVATEISEHSEKNFDGYGWTGCYVRNESSFPTRSKNYRVAEFADFLKQNDFWEYSKVTTGYSSKVIPCENTRAFMKQSIIICFDFEDEAIKNIWHNLSPHKGDNKLYKKFLLAMATKYNFLLADWWKSIIVDISNPQEIERYFVYDE